MASPTSRFLSTWQWADIMDFKKVDNRLSVSGQLSPDDLAELKAEGVSVIINNRPDGEQAGQPASDALAAAAGELGLNYHHIPVVPGQADPADARQMVQIVEASDGWVHAFCRTGNRSSTLWAMGRSQG